jgi:hypothetical protein
MTSILDPKLHVPDSVITRSHRKLPVLRILDVYPKSHIRYPRSRIPVPTTATKEGGKNYFIFEKVKKKIDPIHKEL